MVGRVQPWPGEGRWSGPSGLNRGLFPVFGYCGRPGGGTRGFFRLTCCPVSQRRSIDRQMSPGSRTGPGKEDGPSWELS